MIWTIEIVYDRSIMWYVMRLNGNIIGCAKNYAAADDYVAEVVTRYLMYDL